MSKKVKPGLRAQLVGAISQSHYGAGQGTPTLSHIVCYRGHLVAKAMGDGGCTGYWWRPADAPVWNDTQVFWADSFDDAFKDVDAWISAKQGNPIVLRYAGVDDFDPRESGLDEYIQRNF